MNKTALTAKQQKTLGEKKGEARHEVNCSIIFVFDKRRIHLNLLETVCFEEIRNHDTGTQKKG